MPICTSCGQENPEGFRICGMCGSDLVQAGPERRKPATLVFCDLSGSTALAERLDAEAVREVQLAYFQEMRAALERHGGTVEKFIGDAVVAAFGVPVAHEDDAVRALRAAAEMRDRLAALNDDFERRYGARLALRIGVNSGEVVAGDPRAHETFVTGDPVNVAARLEQAAQPGEILVGEPTIRLARDAVEAEPIEPLTAKGKSQPVPAYRLVRVQPDGTARARPHRAPMIGRDSELLRLSSTFAHAVEAGSCRTCFVVGEPGVGKSRLVEELLHALGDLVRPLGGGCLSYGEGVTYWPLAEIVRSAARLASSDDVETARSRVGALVASEPRGDAIAAALADVLGIGSGVSTAAEIAWAARRLLESLASAGPLLVVLDDLHWADEPLLDLVEGLSADPPSGPILVVGLARPELLETRPWPAIRLEPLEDEGAAQLVDSLLRNAPLDERSRRRAVAAAGGNPLFAEELVAMLLEDPQAEIPPTLDALLSARLDLLPPAEREAAERGAVEGAVFHPGAILELSSSAPDVAAALAGLERRALIAPVESWLAGEEAFRFRHILIRDAAYRGVPKRLRSELHERYADWLERAAGDRVAEYAEIVAYHLEQAFRYLEELGPVDVRGRALALRAAAELVGVGERASARGDSGAAASAYASAIELNGPEAAGRARLLAELGWTRFETGDIEGARSALAQAASSGDEVAAARAAIAAVTLRLSTESGSGTVLRDQALAAVPVLEEAGDELGLARAWRAVGNVALLQLGLGREAAEA
ncbi:MAG TPA: AAA family ATPase, partial [Gaiellaceae bacterium]|nr:AAA family ATPase [Gaiellaceae bacterium]